MTKNPEDKKLYVDLSFVDEGLVTKGAVEKAIADLPTYIAYDESGETMMDDVLPLEAVERAIDKLPAVLPNSRQAGKIKSPEQIEQVIKKLGKPDYAIPLRIARLPTRIVVADAFGWVLDQTQDTWTDKELLG